MLSDTAVCRNMVPKRDAMSQPGSVQLQSSVNRMVQQEAFRTGVPPLQAAEARDCECRGIGDKYGVAGAEDRVIN